MVRTFFVGFAVTSLVLLVCLVGIHVWCGDDLPSLAKVRSVESAIRTEIYARDGRLIATLSREDRSLISLNELPPYLVKAVLAIEDRNFYSHWGVDPMGLARAGVNNLRRPGSRLQGGSTITQQLAWNLFLTHEQTVQRKLKELVLTLRLERSFSKDEILQLYLNEIYFGDGAYGVGTASRRFFGKAPKDLTLAEAAVLAGIPKHPARYSPIHHPKNALQRRNVVLKAMLDTRAITRSEFEGAASESLRTAQRHLGGSVLTGPYFVEAIRQKLVDEFGSEATYEGGLKVYTTLDVDLQSAAERHLEDHLRELESTNQYLYLRRHGSRPRSGAANGVEGSERLQGAVAAMDPRSGAVRALVGGRSFSENEFNRAVQAKRQPGSAFKPFLFAAAFEEGMRPTDVLLDAPIVRTLPNGDQWSPRNFSNTYQGPVTLRETLSHSINVPSVLLLERLGVERVIASARRCGITSRIPAVLSIALGTAEVSLLELTAAYGSFANRGIYCEPYLIERVEDRTGRIVHEHETRTREALDEKVAYMVTDLLRSVVDEGTGSRARTDGLAGDLAGKTGTTDDYTDAWFVGYNDRLLAGVWVGFDQKTTIGNRMTGSACALPIWSALMKTASGSDRSEPFLTPGGVVRKRVCRESGQVAGPYCPEVVDEVFIRSTAPERACTLHEGRSRRGFPDGPTPPRGR